MKNKKLTYGLLLGGIVYLIFRLKSIKKKPKVVILKANNNYKPLFKPPKFEAEAKKNL